MDSKAPVITSFKPVGSCYVHPQWNRATRTKPNGVEEENTESSPPPTLRVPLSEIRPLARVGGTVRSSRAAYQAAYQATLFTQFPPSGIVMVKDPRYPEQVTLQH
jgi:hypothetical protein